MASSAVTRVSLWTDVVCNGGTFVTAFDIGELAACQDTLSLDQDERAVFAIYRDDDRAALIARGQVARFETADTAVFTEWRVADKDDVGVGTADPISQFTCESLASDLTRAIYEIADAAGVPSHAVLMAKASLADVLDGPVRDALDLHGFGWIVTGPTLEPTGEFDLQDDYPTARGLVAQAVDPQRAGGEFRLDRNAKTNYRMNVYNAFGSTAPSLRVRTKRNLLSTKRRQLGSEYANRCIPRGIDNGTHRGLGYAYWVITARDTGADTLTIADPRGGSYPGPIGFDNQFLSGYVAEIGVAFHSSQILATSAAAQTVSVADASLFTVGNFVEFRLTSGVTGTRPWYLDNPAAKTTYGGVVARVLERPGLSGAINYVGNPDFSVWSNHANPPDGVTTTGTGTFSFESTITQFGGASLKWVTGAAAAGTVRSPTIKVYDDAPYAWRFWAWIYVEVMPGNTGMSVDLVRADTHASLTGTPQFLTTAELNSWVLVLIETDAVGAAGGGCQIEVNNNGTLGTATVYVDAFGVQPLAWTRSDTYTPDACDVHHAANAYLASAAAPISYDVSIVDLERLDGTHFPDDALALGGTLVITDDDLGVTTTQRLRTWTRNHIDGTTQIALGTPVKTAAQTLAPPASWQALLAS